MRSGSDGHEIMDVFGREQSKARDSGMRRRRIVREENHSQIFSSARTAHVQQTPCPVESCLVALTLVGPVRIGRRRDSEELPI